MAEHDPHAPAPHDGPGGGDEKGDVNVSAVIKFGAGLVAFGIVVHLVLAWVYGALGRKTESEQPRLTPIARQAREREQQKVAKQVEALRNNPDSPTTPQPPQVYERIRTTIPLPRLQVNDEADLAALRREEEKKLTEYDWVDEKAGVVQIPIERAMRLLTDPKRAADFGVKVKGKGGR
jgi:hypothetical protein